jgi:DnaJ like chaperone protein
MWWGKIIGVVLGFMLAGWFGAFLGLVFGHISDVVRRNPLINYAQQLRQLFFDATFLVMGYIAKSDGRVSEAEINAARQIMQRMGLDEKQKQHAMHLFMEGKSPDFSLDNTLTQILRASRGNFILLQVFIDIQTQAVQLSGDLSSAKKESLHYVFSRLGYRPFEFRYQQSPSQTPQHSLSEAYALLGIEENATDAEVKQAYRRLMSQHHPDKLMAKGLTEELMKMATEKAQHIQLAYDQIRKARGF